MLQLLGIGKCFPPNIWALQDINFSVKKGEALAVLGASGSGKTTLFDIIGTLSKPTQGEYLIDGVNMASLNEKKISLLRRFTIGYVFQAFNLIHDWTVHKNLLLALKYHPHIKQQDIENKLDEIGLAHKLHAKINTLSGGEQQRVAIVRTILRDPQLILADEPTGNLDNKNAEIVMNMLFSLNKLGKTIIMITHNQDIAKSFSRTIHLINGHIVSQHI